MRLAIIGIILALNLGACSTRLPRPTNSPESSTHEYQISLKDQSGNPIEGARLTMVKTDLATYFGGNRKPTTEVVETDGTGRITTRISAKFAQHWKGGYYNPENEPTILKQEYPHGGKDIWGYMTELRIRGNVYRKVITTFTQKNDPIYVIDVPIIFKTPGNISQQGRHQYTFMAVDKDGKSVAGVKFFANIADHSKSKGDQTKLLAQREGLECITDSTGLCTVDLAVKSIVHYRSDYLGTTMDNAFNNLARVNKSDAHLGFLSSSITYGSLGGFFKSETLESFQGSYSDQDNKAFPIKIIVPSPQDYYCSDLKQPAQIAFSEKLDVWVRTIKLSGDNRNAELERMCRQDFKGKSFIALTFKHRTKFNELKLNNYGIGTIVFDEVVRKLLDPIASASSNLPVDGYKITVRTQKNNFSEKFSPSEFLNYDFYLNKDLVRKYKQADITGQQLINGSIILLDGERIDLELK